MSSFKNQLGNAGGDRFDSARPDSPAARFDADIARRALDELFVNTKRYATGKELGELFAFLKKFRFYSPFNAMLLHIQNPGTTFAVPARRWLREYQRAIKPGARPLVILQPMGPVMFVFDVSDTEPESPTSPPLPREVFDPFVPMGMSVRREYGYLTSNVVRDGVRIIEAKLGSQMAGQIMPAAVRGSCLHYATDKVVPHYYDTLLNANHDVATRFTTLVHELGHLYSGHLGLPEPKKKWWPDRRGMDLASKEFEAESIAYLVCLRIGVNPPSARYLSGYLGNDREIPQISLDRILVATGLIERMCRQSLPPNAPPKHL